MPSHTTVLQYRIPYCTYCIVRQQRGARSHKTRHLVSHLAGVASWWKMTTSRIFILKSLLIYLEFRKLLICSAFFSTSILYHRTITNCRKSRGTALFINCSTSLSTTKSDNTHRRIKTRADDDNILITPSVRKSPESTFWYSIPEKQLPNYDTLVPCDPYLDIDGPLPLGSYKTLSPNAAEIGDITPTCLITIAVDVNANRQINERDHNNFDGVFDKMDVVRGMHRYIDRGFTSFQIADAVNERNVGDFQTWGEGTIFGTLRKETPRSVLNTCHLTSKVRVPGADVKGFSKTQIRDMISDSLLRIGGEHLDAVQVQCEFG